MRYSIESAEQIWRDEQEINDKVYDDFYKLYSCNNFLIHHREFIKSNNLGYGEDPFHYLWWILLDDINERFNNINFLEIGVYKGQVLSLVPYLSKIKGYDCKFKGVTPLTNAGDKYSVYPPDNYLLSISNVFSFFDIPFDANSNIIQGFSTNPDTIKSIQKEKYNLLYIDGSHDYDDVMSDINLMHDILEVGGCVVFDDASVFLKMPPRRFNGHLEVSKALENTVCKDDRYSHLFACGHNRVFRKVK